MKSEERHDIETNELAKLLMGGGNKVGPYVSFIIYGLLAVAAVWAIVRLTSGNMQAKQLQAWDSYTIATLPGRFDTEQLKSAAAQYAGEPIGELAQIAWADSQLSTGCQGFFSNKQQALESLDGALKEYQSLASSAGDKNLRDRAQLGIAKTLEAKGEITAAIAEYEKVTGPFSEMADARAKELEEINAADYADWLAVAQGATLPTGAGSRPRPNFSADPLDLPGGDPTTGGVDGGEDFLELFDRYQESAPDKPDQYDDADAEGSSETGDAATESQSASDDSTDTVEEATDDGASP